MARPRLGFRVPRLTPHYLIINSRFGSKLHLGVGAAPISVHKFDMRKLTPRGAEAQTGPRHDVMAASRWRSSWEAGCQQLTAEMGVND